MNKDHLLETLKRLLSTDTDLSFLVQLKQGEIETLIACIRNRIETSMG